MFRSYEPDLLLGTGDGVLKLRRVIFDRPSQWQVVHRLLCKRRMSVDAVWPWDLVRESTFMSRMVEFVNRLVMAIGEYRQ